MQLVKKSQVILGISCFYHDSAAAFLVDGKVVFASQEERFTRKKHDPSFPVNAVFYGMEHLGLKATDIDHVVFYEKPLLKFNRLLETYIDTAPFRFAFWMNSAPLWFSKRLNQRKLIGDELKRKLGFDGSINQKIKFCDHHLSHAASAFFPSPFKEALILTVDGVGEHATTSISIGRGSEITTIKTINYPHSLGLLYSAFTAYCGFRVNSGEYKLMGLAPFGEPTYLSKILQDILILHDDGSFSLNMIYFDAAATEEFFTKELVELLQVKPLPLDAEITKDHMDLAASIQAALNIAIENLTKHAFDLTGIKNIVLAGGVALNCVSNSHFLKNIGFNSYWIQPAAGDAGGSLGAALAFHHMGLSKKRLVDKSDSMSAAYLGRCFDNSHIKSVLKKSGLSTERIAKNKVTQHIAAAIASGKVVGWFRGRAEFGPRALGNRSILADARSSEMQEKLNMKIKFRESFRPFAPSILAEHHDNWFVSKFKSEYMLLTANVREDRRKAKETSRIGLDRVKDERSQVPAVTHLDNSARVQCVAREKNKDFHELITEFYKLTGVPMVINTSFNVRGEPIVESIEDAIKCFLSTEMDILCVEDFVIEKSKQESIESHLSGPLKLD